MQARVVYIYLGQERVSCLERCPHFRAVLIEIKFHCILTRKPVLKVFMCYCVSRVLRQIFQSLKVIVDVILLLFFVVAFFALIGQFEFEIRITHCD